MKKMFGILALVFIFVQQSQAQQNDQDVIVCKAQSVHFCIAKEWSESVSLLKVFRIDIQNGQKIETDLGVLCSTTNNACLKTINVTSACK